MKPKAGEPLEIRTSRSLNIEQLVGIDLSEYMLSR